MNDVANPRLHWCYTDREIVHIPEEAIPNPDYDTSHVLPRIRRSQKWRGSKLRSTLHRSVLYRAVAWRARRALQAWDPNVPDVKAKTPTCITSEDALSIEVLLDERSPEWRWLRSIYDRLHEAVEADQARLFVAVFPLAYQLDEGYPYFPQTNMARYCRRNGISYIDILEALRRRAKGDVFLLEWGGFYDVCHLTELGHELSARHIAHSLRDGGLW